MRASDTLARFGGDEFALLMSDIGDPTDAGVLADKLLQIMTEPFLLDGNQIHSGVSIGIATYEPDARMPRHCSRMPTWRFIGQSRKAGTPIGSSPTPWMRKCANA